MTRLSVRSPKGAERGSDKSAANRQAVIQSKAASVSNIPSTFVSVHHVRQVLISETRRSEEHTSELQSLMRISYAVFCLKKKNKRHSKLRATKRINLMHTTYDKAQTHHNINKEDHVNTREH